MTFRDWVDNTATAVRENGLQRGLADATSELRLGAVRRASQVTHDPTLIWDHDWDLLLVLDACRLDLLASVADEYEFLDEPGEMISAASSTTGWMEANFRDRQPAGIEQTAYVTGNPNSTRGFPHEYPERCDCGAELSPSHAEIYRLGETTCPSCNTTVSGDRQVPVEHLREVWRDHWDNNVGTIRARPVTDATISTARQHDPEKIVVHYMQPHHPFVTAPELDEGSYIGAGDEHREKRSKTVWEKLEAGELDETTVWTEYQNNLRHVLDDVELLLENVDAETVAITADHGNAMGEWGLYGHPKWTYIDSLVRVPWYVTSATDERTYEPAEEDPESINRDVTADEVEDRLRDLGYR